MKTTVELKWERLQRDIDLAKLRLLIVAMRHGGKSKQLASRAERLHALCSKARVESRRLGFAVVAEELGKGKTTQ